MSPSPMKTLTLTLILLFFSPSLTAGDEPKLRKTLLHFYFHDIVSGPKPTSLHVAGPKPPAFGDVFIFDDPLTTGPNRTTSKTIGKAQGMYYADAQSSTDPSLMMSMTINLSTGKFNGSTIAVLGRNNILAPVRELPIVGGTGAFRMARGFMFLKTFFLNTTTGDAIIEYNVTVLHY